MHILVTGTTVTDWGTEPPTGEGVPFDVDDGGFLGNVGKNEIPHWDGVKWWKERDRASAEEVLAAIVEAQQETLLPIIPDEVIERMDSWFPEWEEGHAYQVGNMVTYGYVIYKCIQAHTSQSDWTPDVAVSLFARVLTSDEPQPWVQPDSTNPYMQGDRVTHNSHIWVSDVDNNVWEPGVYGWTIDD